MSITTLSHPRPEWGPHHYPHEWALRRSERRSILNGDEYGGLPSPKAGGILRKEDNCFTEVTQTTYLAQMQTP